MVSQLLTPRYASVKALIPYYLEVPFIRVGRGTEVPVSQTNSRVHDIQAAVKSNTLN